MDGSGRRTKRNRRFRRSFDLPSPMIGSAPASSRIPVTVLSTLQQPPSSSTSSGQPATPMASPTRTQTLTLPRKTATSTSLGPLGLPHPSPPHVDIPAMPVEPLLVEDLPPSSAITPPEAASPTPDPDSSVTDVSPRSTRPHRTVHPPLTYQPETGKWV